VNDVKKKPKKRHAWTQRPGTHHLRWCPRCGVYEDTKTLRREYLRSVSLVNRTIYRPMGQPGRFYTKQPACTPPPEGTLISPPPPWGGDALTNAVKALAGEKATT